MTWRMQTRVADRRRGRWWLGAGFMVGGAVAAIYFLDPEHGRARRIRFTERATHAARALRRNSIRELTYARGTVKGRLLHLFNGGPSEFVEGSTLLDRVESELFRDRSIPHGRLTFEVEGTTVILRGQVQPDDMARIEAAVRKIPGVTDVKSLMHPPGTPAPNKADALIASANAAAEERERSRLPES